MEEAYTSKSLSEGHLPKPIPSSFSNLSLKVADERRSRPFPGTFIYQQGRQAQQQQCLSLLLLKPIMTSFLLFAGAEEMMKVVVVVLVVH